jgi:hypothetical protein
LSVVFPASLHGFCTRSGFFLVMRVYFIALLFLAFNS